MTSWNSEKTARICRERCGGATYLAYNMIGAGLMGSHSGVTAEGDNSVLMQKVTKDLLAHAQSGKHKMPKILKQTLAEIANKDDISPFNCLKSLIYIRE
jgi:acyl-CoA oxidase